MSEKTHYTAWQQRQRELSEAAYWNNLPKGPRYQNDTFTISPAHSVVKLTRTGQQSHGGKNYWESPDALNKALLEVIIKNASTLIPEAIALLKSHERAALLECKGWVAGMQAEIEEIEEAAESTEEVAARL